MEEECLLLLYCSLMVAFSHSGAYRIGNGTICNECPPGTYLHGHCTASDPTPDCQSCKVGIDFQPDWKAVTSCAPCSSCNNESRKEIGRNCTTTSDTFCQCKAGYYRRSETDEKFVCIEHTKCKPGEEGLMRQGDRENNSVCEKCINGSTYFETTQQPCQPCTNCTTKLCAPFCNSSNPVTTQKTAGLPGWAIGLIIMGLVVVGVFVLLVRARNGKGPMWLQNCFHDESSNAASAPPEESRLCSDDINQSPRMNGQHCTHELKRHTA